MRLITSTSILATIVGVTVVCLVLVFAQKSRNASRQVRPRRATSEKNVITLKGGDDLKRAVRMANFGDTIVLQAGATYLGPLILPYKGEGSNSDADYITIQTSDLKSIANDGERIKPELHARFLPKIVSPGSQVAVGAEEKAHHYRFIGIEFAPAVNSDYVYNLIDLGRSEYKSLSQFPHHLTFDRCYVHSTGLNKARRGFALNSAETSIMNCYVSGFAGEGDETQAIAG